MTRWEIKFQLQLRKRCQICTDVEIFNGDYPFVKPLLILFLTVFVLHLVLGGLLCVREEAQVYF